jgi:ABC-2 type transport system permease protein
VTAVRQFLDLTSLQIRVYRADIAFMSLIQVALALGLILGFGYFVPNITTIQALYITTGAATNALVTLGLVGLPQTLAQGKADGRLEYFLTFPVSRELYLLSLVTHTALVAMPGAVFCVAFGAWHYGFGLYLSPALLLVVPLSILSLAGIGVAMAVISPHQQLTAMITQLIIFYVLLFAPVMVPASQLPAVLRHAADFMPPTYVADAVRATLTNLPGTHLAQSLALMAGFSVLSLALSSYAVRRRA